MYLPSLFSDVLDVVRIGADERDVCPCEVLPHISQQEGYEQTVHLMVTGILRIIDQHPDVETGYPALAHFVAMILATGYGIGAEHAYEITMSTELVVPNDLASTNFVESWGDREHE